MHFDHRTEKRASHATRPARDQFPDYRERMLCIRQRVADGAYSTPSMIAAVARRMLDSGALR